MVIKTVLGISNNRNGEVKMKRNKFVIIFIIIIIAILFIWIISSKKDDQTVDIGVIEEKQEVILENYIEHLENGVLNNTSEKLKQSREIEDIKIDNIKIMSEDITKDKVTLIFDVQNISNRTVSEKQVNFIMYDFEQKEIGKAEFSLPNLDALQTVTLELDMTAEFINTYDILIEKIVTVH